MNEELWKVVQTLRLPEPDSHKGQNGRLLIVGGSHFFHAASLWSLTVASRIVDLVHYSSVPENNQLVHELKKEFRNGIVVPREEVEEYVKEDDVVLIGPGMVRVDKLNIKNKISNIPASLAGRHIKYQKLDDILKIEDEGELTGALTNYLLIKYPEKQWVIDAGALQMMELSHIPKNAILTPHNQEFELLLKHASGVSLGCHPALDAGSYKMPDSFGVAQDKQVRHDKMDSLRACVQRFAKSNNCIVLLKGHIDIASNGKETRIIEGGNAGMTKGGTGDVLAGLIAALSCKNDPWTATLAGSVINKKAGDELFDRVGPFFNATDLANQIPKTMKELICVV